jgi:hypothetical protein
MTGKHSREGSTKRFEPGEMVNLDCTKKAWSAEVVEDRGDVVVVKMVASGQQVLAPKSAILA